MRIILASVAASITLLSSVAASAAPVNIHCEKGSFADRISCELSLSGS